MKNEETLYDRLGSLLNETLETGHVKFVHVESKEENIDDDKKDNILKDENVGNKSNLKNNNIHNNFESSSKNKPKRKRRIVYISPDIERAFRLFDLTVSASESDLKKAYKEKLKYFHPDKYADNEVLRNVATKKTRQIVESYKLLLDFYRKK